MPNNKSIFGPYAGPNENLRPTEEELAAFLKSVYPEGRREPEIDGLAKYRKLLSDVDAFERHQLPDEEPQDLRKRMVFGALCHTRFANASLLPVVERYLYHLHALSSLDFNTPTTFISAAEKEIGRLNRKRLDDAVRMARLEEMIGERKKILARLKRQWMDLAVELRFLALYIRDNLVRIGKLCEISVIVLAEQEAGRKKELIEGVKTSFKTQLKDTLRRRQVTKRELESAKQKLDAISMEIADFVREDIEALTTIYEAIRDHTKKTAIGIAVHLADIESKKGGSVQESRALFERLGQDLVSLISDHRLEPKKPRIRIDTPRRDFLTEKRKETLDYLFEQVRKERRTRIDRRSERDRRQVNKSNFWGAERRSDYDRRVGKVRRKRAI